MKKFLLTFLVIAGFSSVCIADDNDYLTVIECNGIKSEIITTCSGLNNRFCRSQIWNFENQSINLLDDKETGYYYSYWACMKSETDSKIIFQYASGGNCPTCERYEIWTSAGKRLADWEKFQEAYKKLGFPNIKRDAYWKRFHRIERYRHGR